MNAFLKKAGEDMYDRVSHKYWPKKTPPAVPPPIGPPAQHPPTALIPEVPRLPTPTSPAPEPARPHAESKPPLPTAGGITFAEIEAAIRSATPFQQDAVARSFVGARVEWLCYFRMCFPKDDGTVSIVLSPEEKYMANRVTARVPLDENRELTVLREGAPVTIAGTIKEASSTGVALDNVRLSFHPR